MSDPAAAIVEEMSWSIRRLAGDEPSAKSAYGRIARMTGLPISTVERLRYRKLKLVPAHCADAIRAALLAHVERQEERFRDEAERLRKVRAARAALACPADLGGEAMPRAGEEGGARGAGPGEARVPTRAVDAG